MLPDAPDSKANRCVEKVFGIWQDTAEDRMAQLIFSDLSTPKYDGTFNVYDDIRDKLVQKGIPAGEIAFIHEYNTEAKKAALFGRVRSGQVRVLIGSTQKMGAGTNVQDRLIALHHLDVPWRPSDLEQREGRILRQGNRNSKVMIFRYITERSFDAYMWQVLENKQKFISQIMTSRSPLRSCEDVDDAVLSISEVKALATGNPLILEKTELDSEVSKLVMLKKNHMDTKYRLEHDIVKRYPFQIATLEERIEGLKADREAAERIQELGKDGFAMDIGGTRYTDRKEAGAALLQSLNGIRGYDGAADIGSYHGFALRARYVFVANRYELDVHGKASHRIELGSDAGGNITRINNVLAGTGQELSQAQDRLSVVRQEFAIAQQEVTKPFAQEAELKEKEARLAKVNAALNMDMAKDDMGGEAEEPVPGSVSADDAHGNGVAFTETDVPPADRVIGEAAKPRDSDTGIPINVRASPSQASASGRKPSVMAQINENRKWMGKYPGAHLEPVRQGAPSR